MGSRAASAAARAGVPSARTATTSRWPPAAAIRRAMAAWPPAAGAAGRAGPHLDHRAGHGLGQVRRGRARCRVGDQQQLPAGRPGSGRGDRGGQGADVDAEPGRPRLQRFAGVDRAADVGHRDRERKTAGAADADPRAGGHPRARRHAGGHVAVGVGGAVRAGQHDHRCPAARRDDLQRSCRDRIYGGSRRDGERDRPGRPRPARAGAALTDKPGVRRHHARGNRKGIAERGRRRDRDQRRGPGPRRDCRSRRPGPAAMPTPDAGPRRRRGTRAGRGPGRGRGGSGSGGGAGRGRRSRWEWGGGGAGRGRGRGGSGSGGGSWPRSRSR